MMRIPLRIAALAALLTLMSSLSEDIRFLRVCMVIRGVARRFLLAAADKGHDFQPVAVL